MTIEESAKQWEEKVRRPSLKAAPETNPEFRTLSDNPVKPLYTPADNADVDYLRDVGFPGQFPFTRGHTPNGYRSFQWPNYYYSGFGRGESANERYRNLIAAGANMISMALDLPTQIGMDSDHPLARGEVGKAGVALASLKDAEAVFNGIDLSKVGIGQVANCIGPYALCLILAAAEKQGLDPGNCKRLRIQNDPIREYTGRGTHILPIPIAIELAVDVIEYVCRNLKDRWHWQWIPQYVNTTHLRFAGVSAPQEIGFALAHCFTYFDAALRRGLSLKEFVPKMDIHMSSDSELFEEVAKYRAIRRLWARLIRERYRCDDPEVLGLRLTMACGNHRLTAQQPLNNLARITMHVLAGMLAGVEQINTASYQEALALPTEEATEISAKIKYILYHECGLENTVDPMGGSYYVESLTNRLEEEAKEWLGKVEQAGGVAGAVKQHIYTTAMEEGVYKYQKQVESGERVVIGVNKLVLEEETPIDIFQVDPRDEARQIERVRKLKQERYNDLAKRCLENLRRDAVKKAADPSVNLVPTMLEAVKAYATVGEIYGVLREIYGEYKP